MKTRLQLIAELLLAVPVPPDGVALPKPTTKRPALKKARPRARARKDRAA